jgi:hypothetical protein
MLLQSSPSCHTECTPMKPCARVDHTCQFHSHIPTSPIHCSVNLFLRHPPTHLILGTMSSGAMSKGGRLSDTERRSRGWLCSAVLACGNVCSLLPDCLPCAHLTKCNYRYSSCKTRTDVPEDEDACLQDDRTGPCHELYLQSSLHKIVMTLTCDALLVWLGSALVCKCNDTHLRCLISLAWQRTCLHVTLSRCLERMCGH